MVRTCFQTILSASNAENIPMHVAALVNAVEKFVADCCIVTESLANVENTYGSAVAVINVLLSESVKHSGNEKFMKIFHTDFTTYFYYIFDWIFQGSSRRNLGGKLFSSVVDNSSATLEKLVWLMQLEDVTSVHLSPFTHFLKPSGFCSFYEKEGDKICWSFPAKILGHLPNDEKTFLFKT